MPLYEYQCLKCHHRFEKIMKFSDRPVTKCPECGGKVEQMVSAPAVQFKGTGWYVTDYAKSGSSKPATNGNSEKSSDSDSNSKDSSSKDSSSKDSKDTSAKSDSKSESSSSKSESKKHEKKKS